MKKLLIVLIGTLISVILFMSIIFLFFPVKLVVGEKSKMATYIDYPQYHDFILDGKRYYEKTFEDGWFLFAGSKGEMIMIDGEGKKGNDTGYYISADNDDRFGIKILGFLEDEIYVFPSEIIYPDMENDLPDKIRISADSHTTAVENVLYDIVEDADIIGQITSAIKTEDVYEMLPDEIKANNDIYRISISLYWNYLPYYYNTAMEKDVSGIFSFQK